jgi:integrase
VGGTLGGPIRELERLLAEVGPTFRPLATALALAGLRIGEALALTWGDVDFDTETISVNGQLGPDGERLPTKTLASRADVPLLPELCRVLRAHRSAQASVDLSRTHRHRLVFTTAAGRPYSARNCLRAIYTAGDAAGLNEGRERIGAHDLRHTFASIALASGVSLPEAAALVRHKNPRVTMQTYAGLAEGGREKAAAKLVEAGFGR